MHGKSVDFQMSAKLEPFHDSPSARAELVPFFMRQFQGEGSCSEEQWLKRLSHWWDTNPFAQAHPCRGWCLRDEGRLVGYLGTIPTLYEDAQGQPIPALIATSWAVEEGHRHAALPMGLMFQRQGRGLMLVDTTPSPEVQQLLIRWGWVPRTHVRRSLVVRGASAAMFASWMNASLSKLGEGLEITTDVSLIKSVAPSRPGGCVQKHITPEYLRWYVASPMREHHFVGVVDREGVLSSYVILIAKPVGGMPTWKVMDWFTTHDTTRELLAIIGWLMNHSPAVHGNWWPFISLAAFLPDDPWQGAPQVYEKEEKISHFCWLPPALKDQPLRQVMAEGDWGL
jgi:hypothetical protein